VTDEPSEGCHARYSSAVMAASAERRCNAVADEIKGPGQRAASTVAAGTPAGVRECEWRTGRQVFQQKLFPESAGAFSTIAMLNATRAEGLNAHMGIVTSSKKRLYRRVLPTC
jgi:hypothetical protein